MPAAASDTRAPGIVRTPDQLQQAQRPEAKRPGAAEAPRGQPRDAEPRGAGVLGQLRTERAHD